jgi:2-oxoglutarate dehydrogenase E1 component
MTEDATNKAITPATLSLLGSKDFVEALYERWKENPSGLGADWSMFFQGFEMAMCPRNCVAAAQAQLQSKVASLIYAYRSIGHGIAQIDPLGNSPAHHPDLELERFELSEEHLDRVFDTGHLGGVPQRATLRDIIATLSETYCRTIGVEYIQIQDMKVRRWLQAEMEPCRNRPGLSRKAKHRILECLVDAELFENFLQTRYLGQKRFSLEGAESLIPALDALVDLAAELGVREIILGMSHRGRLNVMANILGLSYSMIFTDFEGNFIPDSVSGDGDVKYHRGYSVDRSTPSGKTVHLSLTANPSHLEIVDPVVEGRARAKQSQRNDTVHRTTVLPLLIHGEAAFSGQGLVAETLNLSQLEGYRTGGTVHVIIDNQIGFTTLPHEAHSSCYATDVAKIIEAPIFHVNGDDPEAVVYTIQLALRFRQQFGRDAVVDMVCYRRHGHSESDEPKYTQPVLYRKIENRPSVRTLYTQQLVESCDLTSEEGDRIAADFQKRLKQAYEYVKSQNPEIEVQAFEDGWNNLDNPYSDDPVRTAVEHHFLVEVGRAMTTVPDGFALNPKIERHLPEVMKAIEERKEIDWATAEALAFGSLLHAGTPVRLSGQDTARGTFSQRHAVWHDMNTRELYIPLNHIKSGQARFCVYNSMLAEASVLGFEYGYSLSDPHKLVIWEAQFGDFANGAQVVIDQFIVSSQSKWQRTSGLVMLLPHGYEGQGPEHSNAYLERYLAACAEENIQVCNLTTPAQYFHALRRQMLRGFRRPLVIMAPKSLLRHPRAVSRIDDLVSGGFREILDDPSPPEKTRRLVLCSGKVFYDLLNKRETDGIGDVALVRIEQFYPFAATHMASIKERYSQAEEVIWAQEESQNRGGWRFMVPHLMEHLPDRPIRYVGRRASASPATGSLRIHKQEQDEFVRTVFS